MALDEAEADLITEGLYLGNVYSSRDWEFFERAKIKSVLSVAGIQPAFPDRKIDESPIQYKVIDVLDVPTEDLLSIIPDCLQFLEDHLKQGSVLLHCHAGVSRSGTVCVAYIMKKLGLSVTDALAVVRKHRSVVDPHQSFLQQIELLAEMNWKIDPSNEKYKAWKTHRDALVAAKNEQKSLVILDVTPNSIETKLAEMERAIRGITVDGLAWGSSEIKPIAFGLKKIRITMVVHNDVSVDDPTDQIKALQDENGEPYASSVNIISFTVV